MCCKGSILALLIKKTWHVVAVITALLAIFSLPRLCRRVRRWVWGHSLWCKIIVLQKSQWPTITLSPTCDPHSMFGVGKLENPDKITRDTGEHNKHLYLLVLESLRVEPTVWWCEAVSALAANTSSQRGRNLRRQKTGLFCKLEVFCVTKSIQNYGGGLGTVMQLHLWESST